MEVGSAEPRRNYSKPSVNVPPPASSKPPPSASLFLQLLADYLEEDGVLNASTDYRESMETVLTFFDQLGTANIHQMSLGSFN